MSMIIAITNENRRSAKLMIRRAIPIAIEDHESHLKINNLDE